MELILAKPRGFCAGVERATVIVEKALEKYSSPIYVRHEIVHNKSVVENFKKKGVVFVEELSEVPSGSVVIFSAHGVAQSVYDDAGNRSLTIIDATCPLVKKVHFSVKKYNKKNVHVILIGHRQHVEVVGTLGQLPEGNVTLVESEEDVKKLSFPKDQPLAFATQTTLSIFETQGIIDALKNKYPDIMGPESGDLCYATTNRQKAVMDLARSVDVFLVVGSSNSSNSNRLREMADKEGVMAYLIDGSREFKPEYIEGHKKIGISSGASAPEYLVNELVEHLKNNYPINSVKEWMVIEEDVHFPLPLEFRPKSKVKA